MTVEVLAKLEPKDCFKRIMCAAATGRYRLNYFFVEYGASYIYLSSFNRIMCAAVPGSY